MILICGDSGSGKSKLAKLFGYPVLECDRYHKWERGDYHWKYYTHLNPDSNDLKSMVEHIKLLQKGETVMYKDYSHSNGKFTAPEKLPSGNNVVVCGLHTFVADGIKIFVDTCHDLKSLWKINRDFLERGHSPKTIMNSIDARAPDFVNYIEPQKKLADYVVEYRWKSSLVTTVYDHGKVSDMSVADLVEMVKNENRNNL